MIGQNHIILSKEWIEEHYDLSWQAVVVDESFFQNDLRVHCMDGQIHTMKEYIERIAVNAVSDKLWT